MQGQVFTLRLTLDFSDLSNQGFAFDTLQGDIELSNKNAFIKKLIIDGPVKKHEGKVMKIFINIFILLSLVTSSFSFASQADEELSTNGIKQLVPLEKIYKKKKDKKFITL